jgi:hypothetical protein
MSCVDICAHRHGGRADRMADLSSTKPAAVLAGRVAVLQPSEIRLVSSWDRSVFFGTVFMRVFCTDLFRPFTKDAPICFGRGPRCCEDSFVFDRELELQCPALVGWIGRAPFTDPPAAARPVWRGRRHGCRMSAYRYQ